MRDITTILLLALAPSLSFAPARVAAQQPTGPKPVQPARLLTLPTLRPPVADTGIFSPVPLPPPSGTRQADGTPGPSYWQQRVDYAIRATLDTTAKRLTGTETIRYTNNSPDTLRFVWMQLDQNLFRQGSTGSLLFPSESRFGAAGFQGGFEIDSVLQCTDTDVQRAGGAATPKKTKRPKRSSPQGSSSNVPPRCPAAPLKTRVDDTMMYLDLATPIPPGGTTVFDLAYGFAVPEHGADRMGRDGALYEIAQWYPRMAVYDDVHGWNTDQYLGQGEFYLEYGNIAYEVTVPAGYIVAGTGVLQNPADVLTGDQRSRLAAALKSDTTMHIVTGPELASGAARPVNQGSLTWRFRADNVRDVAWAASPEYLWDASGWEGVLAQAYYRPSAETTWRDAAKMSRFSIQEYSTRWLGYPYPQISAVEGPVSGMEYPMLAMEAKGDDGPDLYNVLTHEIGHMWYPMVVGSDERRYAWMDEGFNTFINTFSEEGYWHRDDSAVRQRERQLVIGIDQTPTTQPIMTPANRYRTSSNLLSLAYVKPSIMLLTLRSKVLGPEVFDSAFREYTRRWAFKHPQPSDFFRTIEAVSGRDLAWFWRGFFYTTAALDQTVESVKQEPDGSGQVTLANLGDAVMPVELELGFDDGTTKRVKLPVEVWYGGNRYVYPIGPGKTIVSARVNPDGTFPDAVPTNDAWKRPTTTATP
ncbi:MAG TPA: M1 family metallopeptidase [Gemmatimonadales bacterium]|nr:M1 family metallopeptidase [Gemmatimonadales bacterium]